MAFYPQAASGPGFQCQPAAQRIRAFAHAGQAQPHFLTFPEPFAVILCNYPDAGIACLFHDFYADPGVAGAGVLYDIRQAFLHGAINADPECIVMAAFQVVDGYFPVDGRMFRLPYTNQVRQRVPQVQVIQHDGPQLFQGPADALLQLGSGVVDGIQGFAQAVFVTGLDRVGDSHGIHPYLEQVGRHLVMQFMGNEPALIFLQVDQFPAELPVRFPGFIQDFR